MKQLLYFLTLFILIAGCNNAAEKNGATASADSANPSTSASASGKGCGALSWFRKGTELKYSLKDGNGKDAGTSTTTVEDVRQEGDALVANYSVSISTVDKKMNSTYRCQGNKIYMDMKAMMEDMFAGLKKSGVEMEVKDASIGIPWDLKPGDKLDDVKMEVATKQDGKHFMTIKTVIKDRKVEEFEKVATPAGNWNCFRMSETKSTTTEMQGRQISATDVKSVQWFNPEIGVIKYQSYDDKGKVNYISELVSFK